MPDRVALPGFDDRAPRDRYCDLILTGGVTSAIAYPAAIFSLAMAYRFNSIGGSSSGAGAAALAAAAEYRRRHGSSDGFRILLERTAVLADKVDGRRGLSRLFQASPQITRQTGLSWLFQPSPQNRRLFYALVPGIAGPHGKLTVIAAGLWRAYLRPIALGVVLVALVYCLFARRGWIADASSALIWSVGTTAFLLSVIGTVAAAAVWICCDVARVVNGDYGLCNGMEREPGAPHPALIGWLHDLIQEIAGRQSRDAPLTFADLANAPGAPREAMGDLSEAGARSIGLQMFTANVTHGRPYVLPQEKGEPPLYFRLSEMRRLFPDSVVEHMKVHSTRYGGGARVIEPVRPAGAGGFWSRPKVEFAAANEDDDAMRELPKQELPIVVASRMSVSFPVLFTAVPLWALDHEARPPVFRRCLFSDGSLCSNFPIHFFDSPIPAWPTFGISLYELPDHGEKRGATPRRGATDSATEKCNQDAVSVPQDHREGAQERWRIFAEQPGTFARLSGFVGALFSTTKDWNDATLARLPGVRDRVARVGLEPGIGGLNILMTKEQIECLACLGAEAARKLLDRFAKPSNLRGVADGWSEHRWVRFNVLRDCLFRSLAGLTWSAAQAPYAVPLREQVRHAVDQPPLAQDAKSQLLPAQAAALDRVLTALIQAEHSLTAPTVGQPYEPDPRPELRIRPPL